MKLYLSSFRLGNEQRKLSELFTNKKVALISNALDFSDDLERRQQSTTRELQDLLSVGLQPEELDLRDYFNKETELKEKLQEYGGVWVRGGNTFVLRKAMKYSGFDAILLEKVRDADFVYAGYSAGVCVLSPTLRGIELVDDALNTPSGYGDEIIWDGLNLIPYSFAPHYQSDHPESELIEQSIQYFKDNQMPFKALRDGEVIITEVK